MDKLKLGIYEHYKGNQYEVIGVGKNAETLEDFVVYRAQYDSPEFGEKAIWVRPLDIFKENVVVNEKSIPRFKYIG